MPKSKIQIRHFEDFSNNMQATVGKILKIDSFLIYFDLVCGLAWPSVTYTLNYSEDNTADVSNLL